MRALPVDATRQQAPLVGFVDTNSEWIRTFARLQDSPTGVRLRETVEAFVVSIHGEHALPIPYPLTVDSQDYASLTEAAGCLLEAQTRIIRSLVGRMSTDDVLARFHLPRSLAPYVDWDALVDGRYVIARFDLIPSGDRYWFCELNVDSSLGGSELYDCIRVYGDALGCPLLGGQRSPGADVAKLVRTTAESCNPSRIVLCDWSTYRNAGVFDFSLLLAYVRAELPDTEAHLVYHDEYPNEWLNPEVGSTTLVYRCFMYNDMDDGGAFYRRLVASGAKIVNTFETEIRTQKMWLALLCDPQYRPLLSSAQQEAIDRYIPPTFALRADTLRAALERKEEYVFKLDRESGGAGVLVGSELPASQLEERLLAEGLERWVVQRYVEADAVPFGPDGTPSSDKRVVLALYMIDGRPTGLLVRASGTSKVVNVSNGLSSGASWCIPTSAARRRDIVAQLTAAASRPGGLGSARATRSEA